MACSAIYFLDNKGKVLIYRNYRGDIENNVIDKFIGRYTKAAITGCCLSYTGNTSNLDSNHYGGHCIFIYLVTH